MGHLETDFLSPIVDVEQLEGFETDPSSSFSIQVINLRPGGLYMDIFTRGCLVLIVLLLAVIAVRPVLSPASANAANTVFTYSWFRSGGVTPEWLDNASQKLTDLAKKGCEVVSTVPIDVVNGLGGSVGGGTKNVVYILRCPAF